MSNQQNSGWQSAIHTSGSKVIRTPKEHPDQSRGWTEKEKEDAIPLPLPDAGGRYPVPASGGMEIGQPRTFVPPYIDVAPYNALCKIFFRNNGVAKVASGWIVQGPGGKGIITAAHVIYEKGHWSRDFRIERQFSGGSYAEVFSGSIGAVLEGWVNGPEINAFWDVGAIIPSTPIGNATPALPAVFDYQPQMEPFNFYYDGGYPAVAAHGFPFDGQLLWETDGGLTHLFGTGQEIVLQARNTFRGGSSGSPWLVLDALSGQFYAAGMQSCGYGDAPLAASPWFCQSNIVSLLRHIGVLP